jgi:hypothetical protein
VTLNEHTVDRSDTSSDLRIFDIDESEAIVGLATDHDVLSDDIQIGEKRFDPNETAVEREAGNVECSEVGRRRTSIAPLIATRSVITCIDPNGMVQRFVL